MRDGLELAPFTDITMTGGDPKRSPIQTPRNGDQTGGSSQQYHGRDTPINETTVSADPVDTANVSSNHEDIPDMSLVLHGGPSPDIWTQLTCVHEAVSQLQKHFELVCKTKAQLLDTYNKDFDTLKRFLDSLPSGISYKLLDPIVRDRWLERMSYAPQVLKSLCERIGYLQLEKESRRRYKLCFEKIIATAKAIEYESDEDCYDSTHTYWAQVHPEPDDEDLQKDIIEFFIEVSNDSDAILKNLIQDEGVLLEAFEEFRRKFSLGSLSQISEYPNYSLDLDNMVSLLDAIVRDLPLIHGMVLSHQQDWGKLGH
ncbi:hypothetical protein FSARC_14234 [Fusarium sarcochroum]|uniref:Uncharacterized protein n=1 Tax=Fusarium sarcochroum TaxID=1208366 RepID=A0A8H4SV79_9HYPO|nr:hypothetical protein FSARC_14234 [Fusarium sarcochroum]